MEGYGRISDASRLLLLLLLSSLAAGVGGPRDLPVPSGPLGRATFKNQDIQPGDWQLYSYSEFKTMTEEPDASEYNLYGLWARFAATRGIALYNAALAQEGRQQRYFRLVVAMNLANLSASVNGQEADYAIMRLEDKGSGSHPPNTPNVSHTLFIMHQTGRIPNPYPQWFRTSLGPELSRATVGEGNGQGVLYARVFASRWRERTLDLSFEHGKILESLFAGPVDMPVAYAEDVDWRLSDQLAIGFRQTLLQAIRQKHDSLAAASSSARAWWLDRDARSDVPSRKARSKSSEECPGNSQSVSPRWQSSCDAVTKVCRRLFHLETGWLRSSRKALGKPPLAPHSLIGHSDTL